MGEAALAYPIGEPVTVKAKKPKAKARHPSKAKSKRRAVPLITETGTTRKSKPMGKQAPRVPVTAVALNPAVAMFEFMGRVTLACAELPTRLVQCRSLVDVWCEQARFAQRILTVAQVATPPRPREASKNKRKTS
jgi:hypothetical protein